MKQTILGLHAETSIHAGTGQNSGVIDLPIQREKHTGYPCIFGSAMKGALRAHAETRANMSNDNVIEVFGPDTHHAADHAGALMVSDARLLLLPVRSLTGHFKWVTCTAILQRVQRDLTLLGMDADLGIDLQKKIAKGSVTGHQQADFLFLEEFQFAQSQKDLSMLAEKLQQFADISTLREQLIIMGNDDFAWLCQHATAITPHISIDNTTKVVKNGALWYEETLPPDTVLYAMIMANDSRKKNMNADAVLTTFCTMFDQHAYLQVGGNETVGMGWCKVKL